MAAHDPYAYGGYDHSYNNHNEYSNSYTNYNHGYNEPPAVGATFYPGADDYYMPELVAPAPQRCSRPSETILAGN